MTDPAAGCSAVTVSVSVSVSSSDGSNALDNIVLSEKSCAYLVFVLKKNLKIWIGL